MRIHHVQAHGIVDLACIDEQVIYKLKVQMRTMQNTKKAMPLVTRQGIMTGNSK